MKDVKKIAVVGRAVLLLVVLASLAACSGGAFLDPGHGYGGSGGGGSMSKPTQLSSNATYEEAAAKVGEIIAYCKSNPTPANKGVQASLEAQMASSADYYRNNWSYVKTSVIAEINSCITLLD